MEQPLPPMHAQNIRDFDYHVRHTPKSDLDQIRRQVLENIGVVISSNKGINK